MRTSLQVVKSARRLGEQVDAESPTRLNGSDVESSRLLKFNRPVSKQLGDNKERPIENEKRQHHHLGRWTPLLIWPLAGSRIM